MVDRINKINPHDHPRVDEAKESLEDEEEERTDGGEGEGDSQDDEFSKIADKTDWNLLIQAAPQNQRQMAFAAADIEEIRFLKINLKTNPSLLHLKVLLKDGSVFPSVYVSIPRHLAVSLQHHKPETRLEVADFTDDTRFFGFVPELKSAVGEAKESLPREKTEQTLSQTIKMLIHKTWIQRIGVQDPDTRRTNAEVVWAYVTALVVLMSLLFAFIWIMT